MDKDMEALKAVLDKKSEEEKPGVEEQKIEEQKPEFSKEAIEGYLKSTFGVDSLDLLVKKEAPALTQEEIEEQNKKEDNEAFLAGMENKWFTKEQYDEYNRVLSSDEIEIGKKELKKQFELGDDDDDMLADMLGLNEDDVITTFNGGEDEDEEVSTPNKKKELGKALLRNVANQFKSSEFSGILTAKEKLKQFKEQQKIVNENKSLIEKSVSELPEEIVFEINGEPYNYKLNKEDKKEVALKFLEDQTLINRSGLDSEGVQGNALYYIKTKNINSIIEEVAGSIAARDRENYERGQKGVPPIRQSFTDKREIVDAGTELVNEINNSSKK